MDVVIRPARESDLARINEIYNGYIVDSPISFDLETWDLEQRATWWDHYADTGPYRIFVADVAGRVVGAAYSTRYRE
ncbi:MAG: GNAT family N-acetyltransferase, partial [Acidimicrobiia bacterium]